MLYDNENVLPPQQENHRTPFQTHTIGSRWTGNQSGRLWDFEGALQFGNQNSNDIFAGMATAGLGHNWKNAPVTPTVWLYYDYANGDGYPNFGEVHTFNQQFPFGHYYVGWMDLVGRQNIHVVNADLFVYPQPWITDGFSTTISGSPKAETRFTTLEESPTAAIRPAKPAITSATSSTSWSTFT